VDNHRKLLDRDELPNDLTRVCPKLSNIIFWSIRKESAKVSTEIVQPPPDKPEPLKPHSQQVLEQAIASDALAWGATTQDQRRKALADMRQIFQQNTKPGDTTYEVSTDGNGVTEAHGTGDHPGLVSTPKAEIFDLTLKQEKDGRFIATFMHEEADTHDKSIYELTQDKQGNLTFRVEGAETKVDGQVVAADGTTTHSADDGTITVKSDNGTVAFRAAEPGAYVADVTFPDGTTKQKAITPEQFQFQQQHSALFVNWEKDHHYAEGAVPPPFD